MNEYITSEENNGIYSIKARLNTADSFQHIFSTNILSLIDVTEDYLNANLDNLIKLESMIGNLGSIKLSDILGNIVEIIERIEERNVKGIYFEVFLETKEFTGLEIKDVKIRIDTRDKNKPNNMYHSFFLNLLISTIVTKAFEEKDIDKVIHIFLPDDMVDALNNFYDEIIGHNEFRKILEDAIKTDKNRVFDA